MPEFQRASLEALRQPLESGRATVAQVNAHVTYPARVQLVALRLWRFVARSRACFSLLTNCLQRGGCSRM
jgi:hypothetical protein